jgi:hypothetical protein
MPESLPYYIEGNTDSEVEGSKVVCYSPRRLMDVASDTP